ncbi:hypothetical protein GGF42_002523 [Coemansia sp. RSA 2424]|nr:hypothetical protein GGF42_002523 [Coemansia sp. RSA 2424]
MPRMVSEIRRMAGGLNSISRHMPCVQTALLPLYQRTATVRLTAEDVEELAPHWETVRKCLLNQGHRHSTWREAKAVVEMVQYFYPLLDGCAKLESDASAVIGLFSHKTRDDADDLSRFRAELTSLGVSKDMLVHRPGVQHYVYSHFEASDMPDPWVHIYADVINPGTCDDEARYGLVVRDACSGWASDDSAYQARWPI